VIQDIQTDIRALESQTSTWNTVTNKLDESIFNSYMDGGWYFTDWFRWSFDKKSYAIPETTTIVTNQDLLISREISNMSEISWDITLDNARSSDFSPILLTSSDESIAVITNNVVKFVSSGNVIVNGQLNGFTRNTNLTMEIIGSFTNNVIISNIVDTVAKSIVESIDSKITNTVIDTAVYTVYDHVTPQYTRNTSSWVSNIDLTCVSLWNSTGGRLRAGTLIGTDCIIFAEHFPINIGSTIRFVSNDNDIIERTLISSRSINSSDIMIGKLSTAISTNDCRPALLLPSNQSSYMPSSKYNGFRPGLWIDQFENAYIGDITSINHGFNNVSGPWMYSRVEYGKWPVSGDSGSPVFFIIDELDLPILIGTHFSTLGGPSVSYYNDQIREVALLLDCDVSTIIDANFDSFYNFGE
jgi:hypothetical protein